MSDSQENQSSQAGAKVAKRNSNRSSVSYPYFDFVQSLEVAKVVHEKGGGACTPDQLVAFLGYKNINSGTYQVRLSSAKQFGLVRVDNGEIATTDRARQIFSPIMPEDVIAAKAEAFLAVELFNSVYDAFQGSTIPSEGGLKNLLLQKYAFSEDRAGPAVKVLLESAEQAGFFSTGGRTKLIRPVVKTSEVEKKSAEVELPPAQTSHAEKVKVNSAPLNEGPAGVHSAIIGLLRELPPPGTLWPKRQKARFVKAFQATLDFIYLSDEDDDHEADGRP